MRLIKFEKDHCMPCAAMQAYLDSRGLEVERVNVENDPELALGFGIRSAPTLVAVDTRGELARITGFERTKLDAWLVRLVAPFEIV